jgi:hypothetical protein
MEEDVMVVAVVAVIAVYSISLKLLIAGLAKTDFGQWESVPVRMLSSKFKIPSNTVKIRPKETTMCRK